MRSKTQEEIDQDIKLATEHYRMRRETEKKKFEEIKKGVKYIHDRGLPLYSFFFEGANEFIVYMTWETKNNQTLFAFAFCSPEDTELRSIKIAKGLLGQRLQTGKHTILCEALNLSDNETALLGKSLLIVAALEGTGIPGCIKREVKKHSNSHWPFDVVCPRKLLKRLPNG